MKENSVKKEIVLRIVCTLLTALCVGWIFSNSLKDANVSSAQSGRVLHAVQKVVNAVFGEGKITVSSTFVRKSAHFSEFALLGALLVFTFRSYRMPREIMLFTLFAVLTAVAGTDESLQFLSEGRAPSVWDAFLDVSGGTFGGIFSFFILYVNRDKTADSKKQEG